MKSGFCFCCALFLVTAIGGCAVQPTVMYTTIPAPKANGSGIHKGLTDDQFDAYYLQASKIRIALAAGASKPDEGPPKFNDYEIKSIPVESTKVKLVLQHDDPFWADTTLNLAKMANTDLVNEIGVEVSDHRIEYINAAAETVKIAVGFLPMAGPGAAEPRLKLGDLPIEIDLSEILEKNSGEAIKQFPVKNKKETEIIALIDLDAVPPDAQKLSSIDFPVTAHAFFYSACRTAKITTNLDNGKGTKEVFNTVKIADPNWIQKVALPTKGKITMHTECGVSVKSEKDTGVASDAAVVQATGKAIKDVVDSVKKK